MHPYPRSRGHLGEDVVIVEADLVVRRLRLFVCVRERRAETGRRIILRTGFQLKLTGRRHDQKIAEVRVPGTAKMGVRKSDYRTVVVLITRTIFVRVLVIFPADVVWLLIGIRRELY